MSSTASSTPSTTSSVLPATSSTGLSSNTTSSKTQENNTSGLRKGEIAGIVLSASLAVLAFAILILFWLKHKKKRTNHVSIPEMANPTVNHDLRIVDDITAAKIELADHSRAEMPAKPDAVEMPSSVPLRKMKVGNTSFQ